MAEQAYAYVTLVPVAKGFQGAIAKEMGGAGGAGGAALATSTGKGFTSNIKKAIGPAIGIVGATFAAVKIGGFLSDAVTEATDLRTALAEVVTLTGETGEAAATSLGIFGSQIRELSGEFGIAQSTLTDGLYSAISAGVPKGNAFDFLAIATRASIAGVTDVETAVDGVSTIINAFGLKMGEAEAVSDSMFTAVKGGKTTFAELSSAMSNVAPAAAAAGVGYEEINAAVATLTAGGADTSVATNQIKAALVGLQRPSEAMTKIFNDLGYENAQAAIEAEGLAFALGAVSDDADGNNGKLQELIGSVEGVAAIQTLAGTGAEKFASELDAQADSAGSTQEAFEQIDATRSAEKNKVAFDNLSLTVGTILLPMVKSFNEYLTTTFVPFLENTFMPAFETVAGFIMDDLVPAFSAIFGFIRDNIATILTFVGVLGVLLIAFNAQAIATKLMTLAQLKLNASMFLNPMALVALAIAAVIAGIVFLATKTQFFQKTWEIMTAVAIAAWDFFKNLFMQAGKDISIFFAFIVGGISEAWANVTGFLGDAWEGFKDVFMTVFDAIGGFFASAINGYIFAFESFFNFIIGGVNLLISALNKIKLDIPATAFNEAFTIGVNLPSIPLVSLPRVALANGALVTGPTNALIGEAGAEVVMPLDRFERNMGLSERNGETLNYYAAPNKSFDAEQELRLAMQRRGVFA